MANRSVRKLLSAVLCSATAAATIVLACAHSRADGVGPIPKPKVVIVSMTRCCPASAWPEAEAKVSKELAALGAIVETFDGAKGDERRSGNELAAALDDLSAVAALRIVKTENGAAADLIYRDRQTKMAVSKHVAFDPLPGHQGVPVAALKIVELLTAGAAELAVRPGTTPTETPSRSTAPPATVPVAPPTPLDSRTSEKADARAVFVRTGAGATFSPGNVTLLPVGYLAVDIETTRRIVIELEGSLSLPGRTTRYREGKVDFSEGSVRGWAILELLRQGPFAGALGAGAGTLLVNVSGHSGETQVGVEDLLVTGYAGATARGNFAVSDVLRLGLLLNAGAAVPRVKIRYSRTDTPTFGWPFVEAAIAASVLTF